MEKTKIKNKIIASSQIISLIIEIFAISFIIGGMTLGVTPEVDAATSFIPSGCCLEANDGSICQEMNLLDKANCKTNLLATSCNQVDNCQSGCCYDKEEGICSLNSPKQKCEQNLGNWSSSATCNIQECQIGCCILGDQASTTTPRECTKLSRELNVQKNYQALDSDGTCNSKVGLGRKGACVSPADDFSDENDCKFTTKEKCNSGTFYEGILCTAKSLKTNCFPAKNTTCTEDSDRMFYVDTCGNIANIYDANKYSNTSYWEKVIPADESCGPSNNDPNCGNCDYTSGSICYTYRPGKDTKPTYGDNVCRNLNCLNDKKHGESWCISDYFNTESAGVAPVGSRWFVGSCLDGEISISPCADYNQETCISSQGTSFSEAKCTVNDWRSCIQANSKESYEEVKAECEQYPGCIMYNDISGGNETNTLPGFKETTNELQGSVGDVGKDANKVIAHCVPKYTPGMVFWTTNDKTKSTSSTTSSSSSTSADSGGSLEETQAICSLGSFTCVTQREQSGTGLAKSESWTNTECYSDTTKMTELAENLNERCRMLGPCGVYNNIAGELGSNGGSNGSSFKQVNIDTDGNAGNSYIPYGLNLSSGYRDSLKGKSGLIAAGSIASLTAAVILGLTGKATDSLPSNSGSTTLKQTAEQASGNGPGEPMPALQSGLGAIGVTAAGASLGSWIAPGTVAGTTGGATAAPVLAPAGYSGGGFAVEAVPATSGSSFSGLSSIGSTVVYAAAAAIAGYFVGQLIGKSFGMSNPSTQAMSYALAAGAGLSVIASSGAVYAATSGGAAVGTSGGIWTGYSALGGFSICWPCIIVIIVVMIATYMLTYSEVEYWVTSYKCEAWKPPKQGDCNLCNNDVRACSEYRCRSLGLNCHYFNDNGEPGWCASTDDIWSATIAPWPEILTDGYKYTDAGETKFTIESTSKTEVPKGTGFEFGVITSKQAQCKIDNKHTDTIDDMSTDMIIDTSVGCDAGNCVNQGVYHKIGLTSSFTTDNSSSSSEGSTLALKEGENELYIRCQNYAGQYNKAEFVVKVSVDKGPDYTPPTIMSFSPVSGKYLKVGANSSAVVFYVNEPSECKYSQGMNLRYEEMNKTAVCMNEKSSAILSRQPCYVTFSNLTSGENNFYFQCKDQPSLTNRSNLIRNINRNSKEYLLNVCESGLNITSLSESREIITGKSPVNFTLEAETSGCINGGEATCYYQFTNSSNIAFINTGKILHSQTFDNLPEGNHSINVYCEDDAGNSDNKSLSIQVELDNTAPVITRSYTLGKYVYVVTSEDSQCQYNTNTTTGCEFKYGDVNSTTMQGTEKIHIAPYNLNQNYFIKCSDKYNNTNFDCGIKLRTYAIQKE